MKEREIEFARLTAETDKMSMKSACDVRLELLTKEKEALVIQAEELKDMVQKLKDDIALEKIKFQSDPEKENLKQRIKELELDQETKAKLREESQALYEKVQTLNAKVNMLVTENHNLKEGQRKVIEDASKNEPQPRLYFSDQKTSQSRERQIELITLQSIQATATALDG